MGVPRAIGVFDAGVGGLTVLRALLESLPEEPTVYLGDTARVPYGTRSPDVVVRYAINNARTLLEQAPLKALVVACNTASAVALGPLAEALPIPVVGVIEAGARAATAACPNPGGVLVLGTAGTVRSGAYPAALRRAGFSGPVYVRACPLLVPLVEEGWLEGDITDLVVERYLRDLEDDVATVVLGCTHYPLLRRVIADAIARRCGHEVPVVDGGVATAEELRALLLHRDALVPKSAPPPSHRVLVTDAPEQMAALAPRFLGRSLAATEVELVDVVMSA
ncbi:MAG: glutamate racemase [Myxococcota bacterium]